MNEQIRGLAEQAADYANTYSDAGADVWFEIYNKKFAELIVLECISIAQDRAAFDWAPPNDVNHIIDEIKEHFGVEE